MVTGSRRTFVDRRAFAGVDPGAWEEGSVEAAEDMEDSVRDRGRLYVGNRRG
jgi:hypothetical protein